MSPWKTRLNIEPNYREFSTWPQIPIETIDISKRKIFHRNCRIISEALDGKKLTAIAERYSMSLSNVNKLLNRALGEPMDDDPPLTIALVPHQRVKENKREMSLDSFNKSKGHACAFKDLLIRVPELKLNLDKLLIARINDKKHAQVSSVGAFFGEFKRTLSLSGWSKDVYPYTSNSFAYEAVRLYYHKRKVELTEEQSRIRVQKKVESTFVNITTNLHAMREIQIDEQLIDSPAQYKISHGSATHILRMARCSVIVAIDADTDCCVGVHFVLTRTANQDDILALFKKIVYQQNTIDLGVFADQLYESAV